jgi:hypothetical protein
MALVGSSAVRTSRTIIGPPPARCKKPWALSSGQYVAAVHRPDLATAAVAHLGPSTPRQSTTRNCSVFGQAFVSKRWSAGVRWAGVFLLLASPLGIPFLLLGGVLSPDTDLGFWSGLSVPYALARVLLAVFLPQHETPSIPVATAVIDTTGWG